MALIDHVYNNYLAAYGDSIDSLRSNRYDSHKKSELRDTYNKIVKSNKNSPLYKINMDGDLTKFAIDLKEQARSTQNVIASMSNTAEGIEEMFHKRIAVSSDPDAVDVEYIGQNDDTADDNENGAAPKGFALGIQRLASPQVNTGNFLNSKGHDIEAGDFSFDLNTPSNSFEFQLTTKGNETNLEIQQRIAQLVNTSDVGLSAAIITNDRGQTALQLTSKQTGLAEGEEYLFRLESGVSWDKLNKLGINNVTEPAQNSAFTLNGHEHSSLSNSFTINKEFEITLKAPTKDDAAIGFKTNTEAISDSAEELLDSFNGLLDVGRKYSSGHNNNRLLNEVNGIKNVMSEELEGVGITPDDIGHLTLDRDKLAEALNPADAKNTFNTLNKFKNILSRQAEKVAVNPMNYADSLIVEYKNPGRSFSAPYAQSAYAGMLLDRHL